MNMPGVDFQAVRAAVSIADVLQLIEFVPTQTRGPELRGRCPVHGSKSQKSRVFAVNVATNVYQCFQCGSAGNQLSLYMAVTKMSLFEAAIDLCAKLNRPTPWLHRW
jgi:DNA primase